MSRRLDCTQPTPNRCSTCSIACGGRAIRCSWSSTTWTWCAAPIGSSTSDPGRGSLAGKCSTAARCQVWPTSRGRSLAGTCSTVPGRRRRQSRTQSGRLRLRGICFHNLRDLDVDLPLGVYTAVTGVSGSGKSTLVVKVLGDVVNSHLGTGRAAEPAESDDDETDAEIIDLDHDASVGVTAEGVEEIDRLVSVDQRPIGRTPRSTLATYTGLFDAVRREFAATPKARRRGWTAGRFSFNVAEGRCPTCQGEGFVSVELLFLPGTYATCPTCQGARYSGETLEVRYRDRTIADVLAMTVDEASEFLADITPAARSLTTLQEVGTGISPTRTARNRAVGWRGPADQARLRTAAAPAGAYALRPRRADHRSSPRRCGSARSSTAPPRRRGQYRSGGRTRHADGRGCGLGDRPGTWRR